MPVVDIQARVTKIVAEQLGREEAEVTLDKPFTELGGDSLDQVELLMAIEDEFGIQFADDQFDDITTARQAIDAVTAKVQA